MKNKSWAAGFVTVKENGMIVARYRSEERCNIKGRVIPPFQKYCTFIHTETGMVREWKMVYFPERKERPFIPIVRR